jgi:hypothetical protein
MPKTGEFTSVCALIIGMSWNDIETRIEESPEFKIVNAEVPNLS